VTNVNNTCLVALTKRRAVRIVAKLRKQCVAGWFLGHLESYSLRFVEAIPANAAFEKCWNCTEARVNKFLLAVLLNCFILASLVIDDCGQRAGEEFLIVMLVGDSFAAPLTVSRFDFGFSWLLALVLVALWNCYCSLRTFSGLALIFFRDFTCNFLLTNLLDGRCVAVAKSISEQSNMRSDSAVSLLWCLDDE